MSVVIHFDFRGKEPLQATVRIHDQKLIVERGFSGERNLLVKADSTAWLNFLRGDTSLFWEIIKRKFD